MVCRKETRRLSFLIRFNVGGFAAISAAKRDHCLGPQLGALVRENQISLAGN
jgi:hypothetical protein